MNMATRCGTEELEEGMNLALLSLFLVLSTLAVWWVKRRYNHWWLRLWYRHKLSCSVKMRGNGDGQSCSLLGTSLNNCSHSDKVDLHMWPVKKWMWWQVDRNFSYQFRQMVDQHTHSMSMYSSSIAMFVSRSVLWMCLNIAQKDPNTDGLSYNN